MPQTRRCRRTSGRENKNPCEDPGSRQEPVRRVSKRNEGLRRQGEAVETYDARRLKPEGKNNLQISGAKLKADLRVTRWWLNL